MWKAWMDRIVGSAAAAQAVSQGPTKARDLLAQSAELDDLDWHDEPIADPEPAFAPDEDVRAANEDG